MNPEKLHDALSLLDEDLIQPVEKLRRRRPVRWQSIASLAACLVVAVALGIFGLQGMDGASNETGAGGVAPEMAVEGDLALSGRGDGFPQTTTPGVDTAEIDRHVLKMESAVVQVLKIEADGFTATVLGGDRKHDPGETLTILFTEHTRFVSGQEVYALPSDVTFFCEGATVVVDYASGSEPGMILAECISAHE